MSITKSTATVPALGKRGCTELVKARAAEIRKEIPAGIDLPGHERTHLLRTLTILTTRYLSFIFRGFESVGPRWRAEPWDEP